MKRALMVLWVGLCLLAGSGTADAIVGVHNLDNYEPFDDCGGVTPGGTLLLDLQLIPIGSTNSVTALLATALQYPVGDFGQTWCYGFGEDTLSGDLLVDWYKAFDRHRTGAGADACRHGAEIVAYYDFGPLDPPLGLDWISLYTESGDSGDDFFLVDGPGDLNPAYYAPGLTPWVPGGYTLDEEHDIVFTDAPWDEHSEVLPWEGGVEFYTFLAGYSGIYSENGSLYQDIYFFDGFRWGYQGWCTAVAVPAPGAVGLVGFGLCLVARWCRRGTC